MKRMLFNATHQEELRVAIVDGQKLIDLDIETAGREQRKGNNYKGIITRIEPGLEACFINYGENRHGFLPFKGVARSYFKEGVDIRNARIQDVLEEGQELIVQVEKEERGNKGAALTTFISLAGRYLVLMPNNPRGGGVSRRVEGEDRQELRDSVEKLDVPEGMSIIARTAGIGRNVKELQWDLSYLIQLWRAVENAAKNNSAPVLIYPESSLVIRAIRDYFSPDIGEILIDNEDIANQAKAFMSVVMPDNVQCVKIYNDNVPLFSRFQIEQQIEKAYSRMVQLSSGGSIIVDHAEALVAIDVNSAKSTRGADIEETALRTNQEAADEVARQLRLRDLGGLIVIDFIDMEESKNQRAVELRLREALHFDRARVRMGKISKFGLIELSRQRLRPALNEGSHITCPRCDGIGFIRDTEFSALQILRFMQEEAMKEGTTSVHAQAPVDVATYLLNEKRTDISNLENQLKVNFIIIPNKFLETPNYQVERFRYDDLNVEHSRTSFSFVQKTTTNTISRGSSFREQEMKPKAEALVKGIIPSSPAPSSDSIRILSNPISARLFDFFCWTFSRLFSRRSKIQESKEISNKNQKDGKNNVCQNKEHFTKVHLSDFSYESKKKKSDQYFSKNSRNSEKGEYQSESKKKNEITTENQERKSKPINLENKNNINIDVGSTQKIARSNRGGKRIRNRNRNRKEDLQKTSDSKEENSSNATSIEQRKSDSKYSDEQFESVLKSCEQSKRDHLSKKQKLSHENSNHIKDIQSKEHIEHGISDQKNPEKIERNNIEFDSKKKIHVTETSGKIIESKIGLLEKKEFSMSKEKTKTEILLDKSSPKNFKNEYTALVNAIQEKGFQWIETNNPRKQKLNAKDYKKDMGREKKPPKHFLLKDKELSMIETHKNINKK